MEFDYDLLVLGSGPGGYVSAAWAGNYGIKIGIIEKDKLGGTCLNRGCVPTKSLLHNADSYYRMKTSKLVDLQGKELILDYSKLIHEKDSTVLELQTGIETLLKSKSIDIIYGEGKIINRHEIIVNEKIYSSRYILIATGSKVAIPNIPGITMEHVHTSDSLLDYDKLYNDIVIIGGGVIGVEFATIYHDLGCKVTIIETADRILPGFDRDISLTVANSLKRRGVIIHTKTKVNQIMKYDRTAYTEDNVYTEGIINKDMEKDFLLIQCDGLEKEIVGEGLLIATGRKANITNVWVDELDIKIENDMISVNESYQTSVNNIYAIGDAVSKRQLAHLASSQGKIAIDTMFKKIVIDNSNVIPICIYSKPEVAVVGLTKQEAIKKGFKVKVVKHSLNANCKSKIGNDERGYIKLLINQDTDVILGGEIVCNRATDMINEIALCVGNGLTTNHMMQIMRPHPTYSEAMDEVLYNYMGYSVHSIRS